MKNNDKNEIDFFSELETDFEQNDDELWAKIEQKTTQKSAPKKRRKIIKMKYVQYAVAMSVLLIFVGSFMRFYTETVFSQQGERLSHTLPDGSIIELNAESSLAYHPFWWTFNREIEFTGEAFFEVEKGEKFIVISDAGITQVLGTSFNIFARNKEYKVYCKTGKVQVKNPTNKAEFILTPDEAVIFDNQNIKGKKSDAKAQEFIAWKSNKFNFLETNLAEVFTEIERQYGVKIKANKMIKLQVFSGYFDKPKNIEQALDLVCVNFDLQFNKVADKTYKISSK